MPAQLPPPAKDQNYVTVSALTGGFITLNDHLFVAPAELGVQRTVPSLSFLITHPKPPRNAFATASQGPLRMLFDLGLRCKKERYPEELQKHLEARKPYLLTPSVVGQLESGGLRPADIDVVVLSHVHYDHHGDPEDFPDSTMVVGPGALNIVEHGVGAKGSHQHFQADLFSKNKVIELPPAGLRAEIDGIDLEWEALGPFPAGLDLFGDGSIYVIDTPGHLPGHINLLCRVGPTKWICLCGDAFHDSRLLRGEKEIGTWKDAHGATLCIHLDKEGAKRSIERLRELKQAEGMNIELIAAHDDGWLEMNKGSLFPGGIA